MVQVSNEVLITAVFSATPEAKSHALDILQGRNPEQANVSYDEFLTTKGACSLLHCSRMTLYRMEQDGEISSVQLRGKKLFEREILIKALKSGRGRV